MGIGNKGSGRIRNRKFLSLFSRKTSTLLPQLSLSLSLTLFLFSPRSFAPRFCLCRCSVFCFCSVSVNCLCLCSVFCFCFCVLSLFCLWQNVTTTRHKCSARLRPAKAPTTLQNGVLPFLRGFGLGFVVLA